MYNKTLTFDTGVYKPMKKRAFILRGLPGGGKSTVARMIKLSIENDEPERPSLCKIVSTDDFFIDKDGVYQFDPKLLGKYHAMALSSFIEALQPESGVWAVILDNTNTQTWEFSEYVKSAKEAGWDTQIITVGQPKDDGHVIECAARNTHGVPLEAIQRMSKRFQP